MLAVQSTCHLSPQRAALHLLTAPRRLMKPHLCQQQRKRMALP